jgi:phosphohistidine phosphatase SixA
MKHLFVLRHGDYDNRDLSSKGRDQIKNMAEQIKQIIGKDYSGFYLASSHVPRAIESASILMDKLNLNGFYIDKRLFTNDEITQNEIDAIDELIAPYTNKNDVVAIMTHFGAVGSYPAHIAQTMFKQYAEIKMPDKGQGIHIDLEKRTYTMFPPKSNSV